MSVRSSKMLLRMVNEFLEDFRFNVNDARGFTN